MQETHIATLTAQIKSQTVCTCIRLHATKHVVACLKTLLEKISGVTNSGLCLLFATSQQQAHPKLTDKKNLLVKGGWSCVYSFIEY